MSLFAMFKSAGPTGFGYGSTAEQVTKGLSLAGQTILVTGCNSGIGQEACRVLALRGALVLGTARTKEKAAACATFPGKAIGYACELSDPSSVRGCVAAVKAAGHRLDAIICNAGIMMLPKLEKSHGYELQFFTNHIGHFMLVTGLLDQLEDEGRVVMLSRGQSSRSPCCASVGTITSVTGWRRRWQELLTASALPRSKMRDIGSSVAGANQLGQSSRQFQPQFSHLSKSQSSKQEVSYGSTSSKARRGSWLADGLRRSG